MSNNTSEQAVNLKADLLFEKCRREPLFWLTNFVKTYDEHEDDGNPVKQFPIRPYTADVIKEYLSKEQVMCLAKSRQMMVSWLFASLATWKAEFKSYREEMFFSLKEKEAHKMVERCKFIYNHQPIWLKNRTLLDRPIKAMPYGQLSFKNGSIILGAPQGPDQVRGHAPSTVYLDEISFQDKAEATYTACLPCAKKIIAFSSAGSGFFGRLTELGK